MTQDARNPHELVSALVDGELRGDEFAQALALLDTSADARAHWHACHVAGDVLRGRDLAGRAAGDAEFVARLRQRLQVEQPAHRRPALATELERRPAVALPAANDALRWKRVAGFASLAALAVVAWQLVREGGTSNVGPQLAQQSRPAVQATNASVTAMTRDPRLDQFLAAHQQFGGASALQKPAGFLRNATFEQPAR